MSEPATSHCCECDALPGDCGHGGPRYLTPIRYERLPDLKDGRTVWKAPEHERWRVEHPPSTWDRSDRRSIDYGASRPEAFPPTTTGLGEHVRQTALRLLGDRYRVLAARAKRRELTTRERTELDRIERALGQLQTMAPIVPLQAGKTAGPFA